MKSIVLLLVAGLCSPALSAQSRDSDAEGAKLIEWTFSVRHWRPVTMRDDDSVAGLPHFEAFRSGEPEPRINLLGPPIAPLFGEDTDLEEFLEHIIPSNVTLRVMENGRRIAIDGHKADVERAAARVRAIDRWLARGIEVRASAYHLPADRAPDRVRWRPDEVAAFRKTHQPVWEAVAVTRPGMTAKLGGLDEHRYVHQAQIEIAKNSRQYVPRVGSYFTGTEVHVRPHALPDRQDLAIFAQLAHATEPSPPEDLRWLPEQPVLQSPTVDWHSGALSGSILDHGAISHCVVDQRGAHIVLIAARWTEPPIEPLSDIGFAPAGAWLDCSLGARCPHGAGGSWTIDDGDGEPFLGDRGDLHEALIAHAMRSVPGLPAPSDSIYPIDGTVVLFGSPVQRAAVQRHLSQRLQSAMVNNRIEIRRSAGTRTIHRVLFAGLVGRDHTWAAGRQHLGTVQAFAEVAEGSRALGLTRRVQHSGIRGWVRPWQGASGASFDLRVSKSVPGSDLTASGGGRYRVPLSSMEQTRHRHHGAVPASNPLDLGDGPPWTAAGNLQDGAPKPKRERTRVFFSLRRTKS